MQFSNRNYYTDIDSFNGHENISAMEPAPVDPIGNPITPDDALNFTPRDIGTTTNPMGNSLESLKARIREGASRIEFEFIAQGKGSSQGPTPETLGAKERQDIRELLKANEMKTSTHASVHGGGLAGFSNRGFNAEQREAALKEIRKAIQFAGEATKGGAVVFHVGEWNRPLSDVPDKKAKFAAYDTEEEEAMVFAVDKRTGEVVSTISKDREIYRPKFVSARDLNKVGQKDEFGNVLEPEDWLDVRGNKIPKDADVQRLFDRVPKFNPDKTNFETEKLNWNDLVKETEEWNKNHKEDQRKPEEMFAIIQMQNAVLQAKGNSLYHARQYESEKYDRDQLVEDLNFYKELRDAAPDDQKWKIDQQWKAKLASRYRDYREDDTPDTFLKRQVKLYENSMRHVHESSASADVQAKEYEERIKNVQSAEKYGLDKTAESIAKAGLTAMRTYNANKEKYELSDPIYVAPENWDPRSYGSHPDEYIKIIDASRAKMAKNLEDKGYDKDEAKRLAQTHIRGTLDIGHLNMFRYHFKGKEGESPEDADKRFNKWMLEQAERLVKGKYVGHIHLTDNFGFDDEHVTPGQGNVPMKEFLKKMEELGMRDMIVEQGSFNPLASIETLDLINSPIYGTHRRVRMNNVRNAHFGYGAPPFFIAGAYVPSNDWKPWTDIPLE